MRTKPLHADLASVLNWGFAYSSTFSVFAFEALNLCLRHISSLFSPRGKNSHRNILLAQNLVRVWRSSSASRWPASPRLTDTDGSLRSSETPLHQHLPLVQRLACRKTHFPPPPLLHPLVSLNIETGNWTKQMHYKVFISLQSEWKKYSLLQPTLVFQKS